MKENVQMAIWVAVATAAGVLLAKIIANTGVIEKIMPNKNSYRFEALDDDDDDDKLNDPVFYI